jgi:hypothetical protein
MDILSEQKIYIPEHLQQNPLFVIQHQLRHFIPLNQKQKEYIANLNKTDLIEILEVYNVILERMNRIILELP